MEKEVRLTETVTDQKGNKIATLITVLNGDGKTPEIVTYGDGSTVIGYNDNGRPIVRSIDERQIKNERQKFMAAAIKEQKTLCEENGVDPDLVNIIGAEREEKKDAKK